MTASDWPADLVAQWLAVDGDVACRQGFFCATTAVFVALGYTKADIEKLYEIVRDRRLIPHIMPHIMPRMLRLSLGLSNTPEDNDRIVASLRRLLEKKPNGLESALAKKHAGRPAPKPLELLW